MTSVIYTWSSTHISEHCYKIVFLISISYFICLQKVHRRVNFRVDLIEMKPGESVGRRALGKEVAALKPEATWGCWTPGGGQKVFLMECLFAPMDCGEVLLFIFHGVKESWFFLYFVISDFLIAVYYQYQWRDCEIGKSYRSVSQNLLAMGTCTMWSLKAQVPFPKSRHPIPVDTLNSVGLNF